MPKTGMTTLTQILAVTPDTKISNIKYMHMYIPIYVCIYTHMYTYINDLFKFIFHYIFEKMFLWLAHVNFCTELESMMFIVTINQLIIFSPKSCVMS